MDQTARRAGRGAGVSRRGLLALALLLAPVAATAQPEEAAGPVLFLCSEHANYVHGQVLNVTGGQFGGMYT